MDDGSKQPHTFGNGQPRAQHPRPFFYVQPPSQPYYYQQWQMNNPYGHYGAPGGLNFGRPCMQPYQYMQYPGFVYPQAPIYPMDYRRMFEPRFHASPWNDMQQHQMHQMQQQQQQHQQQQYQQQQYHHHQQQQPYGRRETACSEAQTDPSDAITKLIECLDKIRATELQGAERELDSGVASQSSGMFSPAEEKKSEAQGRVLPPAPDGDGIGRGERGERGGGHPESPAVTFSDSTAAVYDGESSQRSLDDLSPRGCWSAVLEEELPLDSSSVHEESPELEEQQQQQQQPAADKHFLPLEKAEVAGIQSDISAAHASVPKCDAEELLKRRVDPILPSLSSSSPSSSSSSSSSFTSSQPALKDAKSVDKVSKPEPSYQILKLPFESVLTPGGAAAGRLSSPTAPYYYNYLSMQTTHERMSVLSPSLDELSSRDEMFSTDLDDADLFPAHVYAAGRRLSEVVSSRSPQAAAAAAVEEAWPPGSKRFMCACCGKSLAKSAGRSKGHGAKTFRDEAGDSEEEEEEEEEEGRYGRGCEQPIRVVVRKHSAPRKPHAAPPRHAAKAWHKRGQSKEPSEPTAQEEGREVCKPEPADGAAGEPAGGELQCRTCTDGLCRDLTTADQGRWGDGDVIPRRRQASLPQRPETSTQRKAMYHRSRDEDNDDDEPPPLHWERGSMMREPRC